ncbi:hypothetical protein PI125_g10247 [Phytophthora idaei]|nr:hypothetical protein PI125_g10247 [Phytophthora idaei]KAG3154463.1 hypothetical protein PI126_g9616 [Phytophthora idaei]
MVQFVYNKGRVTTAASNRAFKIAAACCRSDILIFLLERADISLEMTFKSALRAKSFDLARLLHKTKRVPLGLLNKVFEETKTVDVVRVLLETKQISAGIIRSTFDNAVDACIHDHCRRGHAKLVAFLCNNEYVSRTAAEHAFTEGVDSGSVLLMKSVCNNRSISPALGAKMLVRAIRKEQFGVVNFLWGQSWIPYEQFAAVFIDAAKHGCLQTVEWFNSYNRASRESITAAFLAAVEEGHIRVARLLLHKQHASPEALNDLIKHASAKHHHHVVAFLLEEKNRRLR